MNEIALVLPGQGSQRVGMLSSLPDVPGLAALLALAEEASGLPLQAIAADGPAAALDDTRAAQPLLFIADWAWGSSLLERGLSPCAVAGHSLGELAALALAGVFDAETGVRLVAARGRLMAEAAAAAPGGMLAVLGLERGVIEESVAALAGVWVANDNAPGQTVLSGTHPGLEAATAALNAAGARKTVPLAVAGPFHSPLMQPARDAFSALLDAVEFADATLPVVQNAEPLPERAKGVLKERLAMQMTAPVRWTETMTALRGLGVGVLVEAGPGSVLSGLTRRVEGLTARAVETEGLDTILEGVA